MEKREALLSTGKPHISYSELSTWDLCSWRHKLQYIDRIGVDEKHPALFFGKCVHAACEQLVREGAFSRATVTASLTDAWNENGFDDLPGALADAIAMLDELKGFMDVTFGSWRFIDAESEMYVPIPGTDVLFKAFIDAVISVRDHKGNDLTWIIDWKTTMHGWRRQKRQDPRVQMQLMLYKHFWCVKNGVDPKRVRCGFVLLKRNAKPDHRCELVTISAGPITTGRCVKKIDNMLLSLRRGMHMKNRMSCTYCPFRDTPHCT